MQIDRIIPPVSVDTKYPKINWVASILYIIVVLNFCLSWFITGFTGQLFRLGIVSALLVFPLFFHKLIIDAVIGIFVLLVGEILLSSSYNHSSSTELYQFLRHIIFSFSMYYVVRIYVKADRVRQVMRFLYMIAFIQLPVVLFQRFFFERFPANWVRGSDKVDFDFGTFPFHYDPALAFFLALLVAFLLFNPKSKSIMQKRWLVVIWLTVTIFFINSQICHLIIVLIWSAYLFLHMSIKKIVVSVVILVFVSSLVYLGDASLSATTAVGTFERLIDDWKNPDQEAFVSGDYSRSAAILFYLSEPIKIIGDGPSRYYDRETETYSLGNRGHVFTFYAEVGIIGLFLSYLVFFLIAIALKVKSFALNYSISLFRLIAFIILVLFSFVADITTTPVVLSYACIVISDYELRRLSE